MTVNKLIEGISEALFNEFGDKYQYYCENIKQGFSPPCFYIKPIEPYAEQGLDRDKKRVNKFVIQFISKNKEQKNRDINDIYEKLIWVLEYIEIDGKIYKGTNMQSRSEDGVLHFFINYNYHIMQIKDKKYMERLMQKGGLKNG